MSPARCSSPAPGLPRAAAATAKAAGLTALSVASGTALGLIDARTLGLTYDYSTCCATGAFAGLALAPLLAFALWHGPVLTGTFIILGACSIAEASVARVAPVLTILVSVVAYPVSCVAVGAWSRLRADDLRSPRDLCPACGYDMSGLSGQICPECGAGSPTSVPPP